MSAQAWRQAARENAARVRGKFFAALEDSERRAREYAADILVEHMGLEDAVVAAPQLFGWTQSRAGAAAGRNRDARIEGKVLERLAILAQEGTLPEPRNLVAKLAATAGLNRNSTLPALRRLAAEGRLPERYGEHFAKPKRRSPT